jgi:hypothetical protein
MTNLTINKKATDINIITIINYITNLTINKEIINYSIIIKIYKIIIKIYILNKFFPVAFITTFFKNKKLHKLL